MSPRTQPINFTCPVEGCESKLVQKIMTHMVESCVASLISYGEIIFVDYDTYDTEKSKVIFLCGNDHELVGIDHDEALIEYLQNQQEAV